MVCRGITVLWAVVGWTAGVSLHGFRFLPHPLLFSVLNVGPDAWGGEKLTAWLQARWRRLKIDDSETNNWRSRIKLVIPNLSISFLACGAGAPPSRHFIGNGPTNMGYINMSSWVLLLTPQDNYLRTMNYDLHTIPICQLSWTTSSTPAVNVLHADFRKVITQFCPIFSIHDALTEKVSSIPIILTRDWSILVLPSDATHGTASSRMTGSLTGQLDSITALTSYSLAISPLSPTWS